MPENAKEHIEIARTILDQLGGTTFVAMTGAKELTAFAHPLPGLRMRLPQSKYGAGVDMTITLHPSDTYQLVLTRTRRGRTATTTVALDDRGDVYDEGLAETFRQMTGLETRAPRIVRG